MKVNKLTTRMLLNELVFTVALCAVFSTPHVVSAEGSNQTPSGATSLTDRSLERGISSLLTQATGDVLVRKTLQMCGTELRIAQKELNAFLATRSVQREQFNLAWRSYREDPLQIYAITYTSMDGEPQDVEKRVFKDTENSIEVGRKGYTIEFRNDGTLSEYRRRDESIVCVFHVNGVLKELLIQGEDGKCLTAIWDATGQQIVIRRSEP